MAIDPAQLFDILVERALSEADIDLDTLFRRSAASDITLDRVEQILHEDLVDDGPIIGRFLTNAVGASENAGTSAYRQGQFLREHMDALSVAEQQAANIALQRGDTTLVHSATRLILDRKDPVLVWIAELLNTCARCLPLHGLKMRASEWAAQGLDPVTIHVGWNSICHCVLVPEELAPPVRTLLAPLKRVKLLPRIDATPGAKKRATAGVRKLRRTIRSVTESDLSTSLAAIDKARETEEGRRTLRLAGKARMHFNDDPFASQFGSASVTK